MSDWEEETDFSSSKKTPTVEGNSNSSSRFAGKGRGYLRNDRDENDSHGGNGKGRGGEGFNSDFNKKNDNDDFRPTSSDGGDDFRPLNKDNDDDDDDGGFKPSYNRDQRGRGRGRGGRGGGFRRDENEGGYKSYDSERNGGGGYGDNDDGGGYKSSYQRDGDRGRGRGRGGRGGGFRRDDNDGGYNSSERDGNNGGGFGGGGYGGGGDEGGDGFKSRDGGRGRGRGRGRGGDRGGGGGGYRRNGDNDDNSRNFGEDDGEKKEPINKEIYIPPEPEDDEEKLYDSGISAGINFSKFDDAKVKVSDEMPSPIQSFDDVGLRPFVLENIKKCRYTKPTPIQKYGIPIIMAGHDVMACAQTGSGKTAAFMIPIINTLLSEPRDLVCHGEHCEPQCLVMAPTRELVIQISNECRKFAHSSILKIETVYGGTSVGYQAKRILNGVHIIVGTAGRLIDYITRGRIQLSSIRYLVLDEADRMLDMGFMKAVDTIVDHETMVPKEERQTLMFSATFPEEIQKLAQRFLKPNYAFITVGIIGGANTDVEQNFYEVSRRQKKTKLMEILEREKENNSLNGTIVFVETQKTADFLAAYLSENYFPTTSIHGSRFQSQREKAISDIKYKRMAILVATDVAARGLDIDGVSHVIQYDISKEIDMYVHRIGRTGRVGNKGRATTFYDPDSDGVLANDLVRILKQAGQQVPDFLESGGGGGGNFQPGKSGNFGAQDFRKSGNAPTSDFSAAEPEEYW